MAMQMTNVATTFKVGDYAYFEISPSSPYAIRRIEELIKVNNGVEARVMCFYRRREIPSTLLQLADKHHSIFDDENDVDRSDNFTQNEKYQLKLKELFLSRQYETLPVTQMRGKCTVYLLHETEDLLSYLHKPDTFFYSLVYEPHQKTLLADRGEIRVGPRFQAEITPKLDNPVAEDTRDLKDLEKLIWDPGNSLTNEQIDQFLVITKSVGTFARALDPSSSIKQPSLHLSVACASRDSTTLFAMDTLFKSGYDMGKAASMLVPSTGPVLCRDEMEAWSTSEANLFEESLEKYGKDFVDIRRDFFPWKSLKGIVEYYYMWKTTDRYVQQRRIKAIEEEKRLKQIQLPNKFYTPPIDPQSGSGKSCESCNSTTSPYWCLWGPSNCPSRLCLECWYYCKKLGGFKQQPTEGERQGLASQLTELQYPCTECNKVFHRQERLFAHMSAHRPYKCNVQGCDKEFKVKNLLARHITISHHPYVSPTGTSTTVMAVNSNLSSSLGAGAGGGTSSPTPGGGSFLPGSGPYSRIILKTKAAFFLKTSPLTKLSRSLCKKHLKLKHLARKPFSLVNTTAVKTECQERLFELNNQYQSQHGMFNKNGPLAAIGCSLNTSRIQDTKALYGENNAFLNNIPHPATVKTMNDDSNPISIPKIKTSTNSLNRKQEQPFQLLTNKNILIQNKHSSLNVNRKRSLEHPDEEHSRDKKLRPDMKETQYKFTQGGFPVKRSVNPFIDAPDDLCFVANTIIKKMRQHIYQTMNMKKPCRKMGYLITLS